MIVPMKKVSLVVMEKDKVRALEHLREAGVLHLEKRGTGSEELTKLFEEKTRTGNALTVLRAAITDKKAPPPVAQALDPATVETVLALADERKILQEQILANVKERSRIEKWGDFDPTALRLLASGGLTLIPYELTPKSVDALGDDAQVIVIYRDKNFVRLVAVGAELPGESPFILPEKSFTELDKASAAASARVAAIEGELKALAAQVAALEQRVKEIDRRVEFEAARADMEVTDDTPAGYALSWLTGYAPQDDVGILKRTAAENNWALLADDPGDEDPVPTKLKNNRLASLIYPLTGFLEVVPGYHEADISGWFLFFFVIFFGMIFGDAGYGLLLLAGGFIGIAKTAKKGVPPVLKLLLLLASSNFLWGVLTCTWFGVDADKLPLILQRLSLPLISNATSARSEYDAGIVRQNMMIVCFSLALLHLSIGHLIAIFRCRTLKILGDIGSIAMLAGMYGIVLSIIASNEYRQIPLYMPCVYVLGAGFVLNFVFVSYDGSIGGSILESCKNIISMILGLANVFSDIMSYIRLWAVGIAGGAIASTVVSMAGPMLGHFVFFIFGVALLVFGHGLNIILNVLSVLVHGVRLNTLEFSGHVGVTWAGTAYKPFAEPGKKGGSR